MRFFRAPIGALLAALCARCAPAPPGAADDAATGDAATGADARPPGDASSAAPAACAAARASTRGGAATLWRLRLGAEPSDTTPAETLAPEGMPGGLYCHRGCSFEATDWAGYGGQAVLLSEGDGPGAMARPRFVWSLHEGHGGARYAHAYRLAPLVAPVAGDEDSRFAAGRDPALAHEGYVQANGGPLGAPTALARGAVTWGNNAVLAFASGVLGTSGPGNSGDTYPLARLDAGLVPTAVAVSPNNELALVTVANPAACTSALVVVALHDRGTSWMMPSGGHFRGLKVLATVPLPGLAAPTAVEVGTDYAQREWYEPRELHIDGERARWQRGEGGRRLARAGYALVAAREENTVAVVDLGPTLRWIHAQYLGADEAFAATRREGSGPSEWPFALPHDALPRVLGALAVQRPGELVAGFDVGDREYGFAEFAQRAYVTSGDELVGFDVRPLLAAEPSLPREVLRQRLCSRPTHVWYGRGGPQRDTILVTCRGDRSVLVLDGGARVRRTLRDARLRDPVTAIATGSRGASIISVGDFASRRVLNYLDGPIVSWDERLFGALPGDAPFAFVGAAPVDGAPVRLSAAEID